MAWGLGLGCNGIVRVLVEPLTPVSSYVEALRRSCEANTDGAPVVVATVYQYIPSGQHIPSGAACVAIGARLLIDEDGKLSRENLSDELASLIEGDVRLTGPAESTGARFYEFAVAPWRS